MHLLHDLAVLVDTDLVVFPMDRGRFILVLVFSRLARFD
jgi:hypothetical protein